MKRIILLFLLAALSNTLFAQVKVTIHILGLPQKTKVPNDIYLAGSFNNWSPQINKWRLANDDNVTYSGTFNLPRGNYEYKLTRGSWTTVESGINGTDIENRKLHVLHDTTILIKIADWKDNYQTMEKQHTASKNVHIINEAFDIPQLNRKRKVWIYLPEGYELSQKRYPVIYMHDGQNLFDEYTGGFGEWGVDEFLDSLKPEEQQVIVVGVDHGNELRIAEYSPYDSEHAKGEGDAYVRFVVETLKPYIDNQYRTLKDAKHTAIAGSSMGGLISMYATLKYPEIFGSAGIFSPAFWVNPQIYEYAKEHAQKNSRYYFVCGDQESDKETSDMFGMVNLLKEKGHPDQNLPATVINGAKHNELQWKNDFPDFYKWLVKGF